MMFAFVVRMNPLALNKRINASAVRADLILARRRELLRAEVAVRTRARRDGS